MNLRVKAFVDPGTLIELLGLFLSFLGVGLSLYRLPEKAKVSTFPTTFLQSHPQKHFDFEPTNGYWYVGIGNDTGLHERFTIKKYERGEKQEVFTDKHVFSKTISYPSLVRRNNALFGWNGTQTLTVIRESNSNSLKTNVFFVTDIVDYFRLPQMGPLINGRSINWGWN